MCTLQELDNTEESLWTWRMTKLWSCTCSIQSMVLNTTEKQPSCQYVRHGIQHYYEIQLKEHTDKKYKLTVTPLRWRDVMWQHHQSNLNPCTMIGECKDIEETSSSWNTLCPAKQLTVHGNTHMHTYVLRWFLWVCTIETHNGKYSLRNAYVLMGLAEIHNNEAFLNNWA